MTKVLYCLKSPGIGGAELQLLMLAKGLKQKYGIHPIFVFIGKSGKLSLLELINEAKIEFFHLPAPSTRVLLVKDIWCIRRIIMREGIDAIISFLDSPSLVTSLASALTRKNIIHIWGIRSSKISFVPHRWYILSFLKSNHIVSNSEKGRLEYLSMFSRLGLDKEIKVIYNGVDIPEYSTKSEKAKNTVTLCMVASNREPKRYDLLLEYFTRFIKQTTLNFHLILVGKDTLELEPIIKENRKRITLLGHIDEVSSLLQDKVDIGVLLTDWEGQPNAIIEYMACGLPVIATRIPEIIQCLSSVNQDLLVNDYKDFARSLNLLGRDYELREKIGKANRLVAREKFSSEVMIDKYWDLIKPIKN